MAMAALLCALAPGQVLRAEAAAAVFEALAVDDSIAKDPEMEALIEPYRSRVREFASETVGYAAEPLTRRRPESGLSNWAADALRHVGALEFGERVEFAVTNFGGLRRDLPAGALTQGHLLEVSPFDNYLTYLEVDAALLYELADRVARGGAVALSGFTVVADARENVVEARVGGERIDPGRSYRMVTIDYLVATWDELFRPEWIVEKRVLGELVQRDAMAIWLRKITEEGGKLDDQSEGRVRFID